MTDNMGRPAETAKIAWKGARWNRPPDAAARRFWMLGTALGALLGIVLLLAGWGDPVGGMEQAGGIDFLPPFSCMPPVRNSSHSLVLPNRGPLPLRSRPIRLVGTMTGDPWASQERPQSRSLVPAEEPASGLLWEFSQSDANPLLQRLPPVETDRAKASVGSTEDTVELPLVSLLPPRSVTVALRDLPKPAPKQTEPVSAGPSLTIPESVSESTPKSDAESRSEDIPEPAWRNLSDADAALFTGVRTGTKIHDVALAKIQHGYMLADRHAYYAARQEFIQVLRMVSRSLSVRDGTTERTTDLADGLRALEEVEDFVPRGAGLEADLNVSVIASAHRTPVVKNLPSRQWMPRQIIDRYFRYAQLKLASAVSGDPDGSIALHALGKLQRRLGRLEPRDHALAHRKAFAFQQAALLVHPYNHLAAHELGVLLADAGRYEEAERLLKQVAEKAPHPVVLRNLARVQYKLGLAGQAAENNRKAQQLAANPNVAGRRIKWVSPSVFASATDATTFNMPAPSRSGPPQTSGPRSATEPELVARPAPRRGLVATEETEKSEGSSGFRSLLPRPRQAHDVRVSAGTSHPSWHQGVR